MLTVRIAYIWDGQIPFRARLLEVNVTAQAPTLGKWDIAEHGLEVMYGYETSRETAQIEGDSALFRLLSEDQV